MKQSIQLRLGQQLTMTPQLQQAIKLLQLSALDLAQEIQEALDSNLMLETEEEGSSRESQNNAESSGTDNPQESSSASNDASVDREVSADAGEIPDELPVDSGWDDVYDTLPSGPSTQREATDNDYLLQRGCAQTLHDHLTWQMNLTIFSDTDLAIATAIVDAVSEDGYLTSSLEDIQASLQMDGVQLDEVESVLHHIQSFDPPGVAARGPQECLLIQLHQLPKETPFLAPAIQLVEHYFDQLVRQDQRQIRQLLKLDDEGVGEVIHLIRSLNPRPGTLVADNQPQYITPDVFVVKNNGRWLVELNTDATPRLRVNSEYANLIRRADSSDDNTYLKNHLQEARWFIKSLQSRNETLLKVATKIVELQRGFFEYGEEAMKPLVLRDVAEALEMHESTISRVTTQKYMDTPRGTLEFKYFFSSHVGTDSGGECSATAIRALIKKLVAAEKPNKPLSDNKIAAILSDQGINVARRTIAKYREAMAIPPSNERKRLL
jgi:RNA polymerase sigma-54 factor